MLRCGAVRCGAMVHPLCESEASSEAERGGAAVGGVE